MNEPEPIDASSTLAGICQRAADGAFRITFHAQKEMVARLISLDEVLEAIADGVILENYPQH